MRVTLKILLSTPDREAIENGPDIEKEFREKDPFWLCNNQPLAGINDTNDLLWAETTAGNRVEMEPLDPAEDGAIPGFILRIDSRRHALREKGNVVGRVLNLLQIFDDQGKPKPAARRAKVIQYETMDASLNWYDVAPGSWGSD